MDRRDYGLTILLVILTFNGMDRFFLGLALQSIKTDLALTDTQLGFMTGIAFALFYAVMGIPIARWADRGNRVAIITLTTAVWSAAVAFSATAAGLVQLVLIRILVAVGEAGCVPPAHSLIADYYPREERPRAMSRYMLGYPLSAIGGYFIAGWLNQFYGWRWTFVLIGLPGLALAYWARRALVEPRQMRRESNSQVEPRLTDVVAILFTNRTFRHLLLYISVATFFAYGIMQWLPAFFMRSYGLGSGVLGTWLAAIQGIGGALGIYLGGEWASRWAQGNERLQLRVMAAVTIGFGFLYGLVYVAPGVHWAFALMGVATVGGVMVNGPLFATIQTLLPSRMRALAVAIIYLFANLIGMGLGPLLTGVMSDALRPSFGNESLRYALLALCPGYFWSAWHLWRASRSVSRDLVLVGGA